MENEFNNYHINNPDGASKRRPNEGKLKFGNDTPRFIKEASTSAQKEFSRPKETFVRNDRPAAENRSAPGTNGANNTAGAINNLSSSLTPATGTLTSAAATTSTVGASVVSAIGGGIGAIAGVAASAVVTAVIVVAVFISTLSVNLSLVMADADCLVFRLEMQNAQAQDFENGVYAVLESNDGSHFEQQITAGSIFVTFTGLKANQEYLIRVQSNEKVFTEKSYITASSRISRGKISVRSENKNVFIKVNDVVLGSSEIFTVTVTDLQGNVFFVKDDNNANGSYAFSVSEPKLLHCTLSIAGVTYAVADVEVKDEPTYDFDSPFWTWTDDTATLSFADPDGGDDLIIPASVTSVFTGPTCEEDGYTTYTATAEATGKTYSDVKVAVSEGSALGHDYSSEPKFIWTQLDIGEGDVVLSDSPTPVPGYVVTVKFYCTHDREHYKELTVAPEDVRFETAFPSCEEDGFVVYYASVVYLDKEYEDERTDVISATGHAYETSPVFTWTETADGWTAQATLACMNDEEHVLTLETNVNVGYTEATCDTDGYATYTATATYNDVEYTDNKIVIDEETALGHNYGEPEFRWTETENGFDAIAVFACSRDGHTEEIDAEVNFEDGSDCETGGTIYYYAAAVFEDVEYYDEKSVEVQPGHRYNTPVFHWIYNGSTYEVLLYIFCDKEDSHLDPITAELTSSTEETYTLYTATATHEGVEYIDRRKVRDENTDKTLSMGVNYFIGDTIEMGTATTYFIDDYSGGAQRTNMSGSTTLDSVLPTGVHQDATASLSYPDILDYDRIILDNVLYARQEDGEAGGYHGSREETSWRFDPDDASLIGVTIVDGAGTGTNPYVLNPVYGVTVTYHANDGVFNYHDGNTVKQYYTAQEVESGLYIIPVADSPEASGRILRGWSLDRDGLLMFDFENAPVTDDITLYAQWIAV